MDTRIISATKVNNPKALLKFLRRGADINQQDSRGRTALWWAVYLNNIEMARFLLAKGADPTKGRNWDIIWDKSALRFAAALDGRTEFVNLFQRAIAGRQMAPDIVGKMLREGREHRREIEKQTLRSIFSGKGGMLSKHNRGERGGGEDIEDFTTSYLFNKRKKSKCGKKKKSKSKKSKSKKKK